MLRGDASCGIHQARALRSQRRFGRSDLGIVGIEPAWREIGADAERREPWKVRWIGEFDVRDLMTPVLPTIRSHRLLDGIEAAAHRAVAHCVHVNEEAFGIETLHKR